MMKIILRKNVARLGNAGEIISVKDGFARNFLLPQGLALLATDDNLLRVEHNKKKLDQERMAQKQKLHQLAERLNGMSCTIAAEAHEEDLYGSISADDIVKAIGEEEIALTRQNIALDTPLKKLGIYEVAVKLDSEIQATIKVWVVKK